MQVQQDNPGQTDTGYVLAPLRQTAPPKIDFTNVESAKKTQHLYQRFLDKDIRAIIQASKVRDKKALAKADSRNNSIFYARDLNLQLQASFLRQDNGGSLITVKGSYMTAQIIAASEILEDANKLFVANIERFNKGTGAAIDAAKQRVAQLTDYNNRLATSLSNLQKTLGDERMVKALESADKIASALALLDQLEKSGRLGAILSAINTK